jgi:ribose transport system substrate-binding protein
MKKYALLFIIGLAFFVCLTGCSRKANENKKKYTIAVIPKGTVHEFWKTVHAGAQKAAEELNVEIIWKGPLKEDDRESQVAVMENIIARGVDGIVLAPLDDTALRMPVLNAKRMGIPVVIFDSGLTGSDYVSYVATDNYAGGQIAGEYMAKLLNGKGKVVVLRYLEGSDSTTKRENGFIGVMAKYPDIEIVSSEQYAGPTTETALQAAENLFSRFENSNNKLNFDGIFSPLEPAILSIMQAAKGMDILDQLQIVGFDSSDMMVASLKKGELQGFVVQNPMQIGYLGVKTMVEHLAGKPVEPRIDTGATLITVENIGQPKIQKLLNPGI